MKWKRDLKRRDKHFSKSEKLVRTNITYVSPCFCGKKRHPWLQACFSLFSSVLCIFSVIEIMCFTGFSLTFSHASFQVLFCLCMPVCLCLSPYVSTCLSLFLPVSGRLSLLYLFVCLVLGVCVCLSVCLCLCLVYVYMSPSWWCSAFFFEAGQISSRSSQALPVWKYVKICEHVWMHPCTWN